MVFHATRSGLTDRLDFPLLDYVTNVGATTPTSDVLIVAIDDRSLADVGQWPWPRAEMAHLVDRLTEAGAKAVVLDVLYPEPTDAVNDGALAAALARNPLSVVPMSLTDAENQISGLVALPPIAEIVGSVTGMGHVNLQADSDGAIRRFELLPVIGGKPVPHLQLALWRAVHGRSDSVPTGLQADADNSSAIIPLRQTGSYASVSASRVLGGDVPEPLLRGKVVMVGATAAGLGDLQTVSAQVGGLMSGVELQANLYQALASTTYVLPASLLARAMFAGVPIVLLFIGFWRLRPGFALALVVALALAILLASTAALQFSRSWLPPGPAILGMAVAYPLWSWRRLMTLSRYLNDKASRLAPIDETRSPAEGFDQLSREVGRLDLLVDAIAQRRDLLRQVIETMPDALCVFSDEGTLILANGPARALFSDPPAGTRFSELVLSIGGHIEIAETQETLVTASGRQFALTRAVATPGAANPAISLVAFADVTEARAVETTRRQLLEFLSHDMRAPQIAIVNLAKEDAGQSDSRSSRMGRIRDHARRTLDLAENFVQISRLTEVPLDKVEIDLGALVQEAADRGYHRARERGITIASNIGDGPVFANVDGEVMARVLDNLIGNSIKYGKDGGRIELSLEQQADQALLVVADDGPGLPEGRSEQPFARFGAHATGGIGLGLAFVADAIARHKGTISYLGGTDAGARFEMRLPLMA